MEVVQGWLQKLFSKSAKFDQELSKLTSDPNIQKAFVELRGSGPQSFAAWRWLSGQKLSASELQAIRSRGTSAMLASATW